MGERATPVPATRAHPDFALNLHRAAATERNQSVCWSPYSVAVALGLAAAAARGPSRAELLTLLSGTPEASVDPEVSVDELAELLHRAGELDPDPGSDAAQLHLAGTAWLHADLEVAAGFAAELARWPSGTLGTFGDDLEQARRKINSAVAETTRGLIRELLSPGVLAPRTVAVLVSALYLKTAWWHQFDARATRPRPFTTPSGPVEVPTMELVAELGYARTDRWQVVVLPAHGGVDAVVLLPHRPLPATEADLTAAELADARAAARSTRLRLRLPRLRLAWTARLSVPLAALGAATIFDPGRADLTGLTPTRPAWVDEVVHQAVLHLDEQGLEGAAATAAIVALRALVTSPAAPLLVAVDRPFLLLIGHRRTGALYFLARVTNPS